MSEPTVKVLGAQRSGFNYSGGGMKYDAPILISGCVRSGTTGLQCTLSAMERACIWFEFQLYVPKQHPYPTVQKRGGIIIKANTMDGPLTRDEIGRLPDFFRHPLVEHMALQDILDFAERDGYESREPQELRELLFDLAGLCRGPLRFYGDKTPNRYVYRLRETLETFPKARVLLCLRDGRDVAASQERGRGMKLQGAGCWTEVMTAYERVKDLPSVNGKVLVVRLEEMAKAPVSGFRRIADFCGFEMTDEDVSAVRSYYKPKHIGGWVNTCPGVEKEAGHNFRECLKRWGYA